MRIQDGKQNSFAFAVVRYPSDLRQRLRESERLKTILLRIFALLDGVAEPKSHGPPAEVRDDSKEDSSHDDPTSRASIGGLRIGHAPCRGGPGGQLRRRSTKLSCG